MPMTTLLTRFLASFCLVFLARAEAPAQTTPRTSDAVVVVCATNCPYPSLTRDDVEAAWSGRRSQENIKLAEIWDLPETNPTQIFFLSKALSKDNAQYRAMWAKIVFNGRGRPPKVAADEDSLAKALADNPGAIGYMAFSAAEKRGLKILVSY